MESKDGNPEWFGDRKGQSQLEKSMYIQDHSMYPKFGDL